MATLSKLLGIKTEAVQHLTGQHAEITAKHNTYMGKDEYAVVTITGEIGGRPVGASDTSTSIPGSSTLQQKAKHSDRYQWNLRSYGSDAKARAVGAWLNQFFDDLTEDEWEQWKKYPNSLWPIHDADKQADQAHKDEFVAQFKEDYERRYRKPYHGSDVDILCAAPRRAMPQDLESVKVRFYKRLDEVRGDLKGKTSVPAAETPTIAISGQPPAFEEETSMQSALQRH